MKNDRLRLFLGALEAETPAPDSDTVRATLDGLVELGKAAWPDVELSDEAFIAQLGVHVRSRQDIVDALSEIEAGDLWLASACLGGCKVAQAAFARTFNPTIRRALVRFEKQGVDIDEISQQMIAYLLFPRAERKAAIANYSGKGPLGGYVRVSVVREAVRQTKQLRRMTPDSERVFEAAVTEDPEIEALKKRYREQFKTSFIEALKALDEKDSLLLRYHYYSGLGVREIASLTGTSKSGVSRQLGAIRERLLRETQRRLMVHVDVRRTEAVSIMRLVRSQLDIGLSQFLR